MYQWIWRRLPGPRPVRVFLAIVLVALVVSALFNWVFPMIAPLLEINDGAIRE
ncbi:MAG: hypothetical protein ACRC0L_09655 [Angustibacter sp.]